jgi:WD40 repeat protein
MLAEGDQVVSGSEDGFVYIYDVVSGKVITKLNHSPSKFVHSVSAHPTKNHVLLSNAGHRIYVWQSGEDPSMTH